MVCAAEGEGVMEREEVIELLWDSVPALLVVAIALLVLWGTP